MKIVDFMGIFPAWGGRALLPWVFPRVTHSLTSRVIAHTKSEFRPRFSTPTPTPIPMSASPAAPLLLHAHGIAKSFNGVAGRFGACAVRRQRRGQVDLFEHPDGLAAPRRGHAAGGRRCGRFRQPGR